EPLFLAVPKDHPLASEANVALRKVTKERLLILKDGHCLRDETLSVCARARANFAAQFEADQFVTIFELIRGGFGVSIVPEMARGFSDGCTLINFEPAAQRRVGYVRLERRYVSKAVDAFTAYLSDSISQRTRKRR
ncbi:MAG: LysR substrate-binding domain-containing protein, partial [Bryobacteraceae bacterium]